MPGAGGEEWPPSALPDTKGEGEALTILNSNNLLDLIYFLLADPDAPAPYSVLKISSNYFDEKTLSETLSKS